MNYKWTDGKPYKQSKLSDKPNPKFNNSEPPKDYNELNNFHKDNLNNAIQSSLNYDENTWELLNQSCAKNGFKNTNKREELEHRLSARENISQIGRNPFMSNDNYLNGLSQDFYKES